MAWDDIKIDGVSYEYAADWNEMVAIIKSLLPPAGTSTINPLKIVSISTNGKVEYNPTGANLQTAITSLPATGGDIYLPDTVQAGAGLAATSITINKNYCRIHGWGMDRTILSLSGTIGIMASENPGTANTNCQWGLVGLQFDNFAYTGSGIWIVSRNDLTIDSIKAYDITGGSGFGLRIICPYGSDNDTNGWADSTGHYASLPSLPDYYCENVLLKNSYFIRTNSFGVEFWGTTLKGLTFKDVLIDNCVSSRAGHNASSTGTWSTGFNLCEVDNIAADEDNQSIVQNMTIQNSEAYDAWESGFHFENRAKKMGVHFINCIANGNGRKYKETTDPNNGDEAWTNPYGAGYLHGYMAGGADSNMTFVNCVAYANGAWGWRSNTSHPTSYTQCFGDAYPASSANGYWTRTKMVDVTPVGGISRPTSSVSGLVVV
jgi:hypothetical protein